MRFAVLTTSYVPESPRRDELQKVIDEVGEAIAGIDEVISPVDTVSRRRPRGAYTLVMRPMPVVRVHGALEPTMAAQCARLLRAGLQPDGMAPSITAGGAGCAFVPEVEAAGPRR